MAVIVGEFLVHRRKMMNRRRKTENLEIHRRFGDSRRRIEISPTIVLSASVGTEIHRRFPKNPKNPHQTTSETYKNKRTPMSALYYFASSSAASYI